MRKNYFADADAAQKGRGATSAPPGRFERLCKTANAAEAGEAAHEPQPRAETTIHWDTTKSVVCKNNSPDIPHGLSANPYRGCEHGCVYCFARPTHSYLGLSPGLDFETQIFAKRNAAALLRRDLQKKSYKPQPLALGIITDSYQPAERRLGITRQMLQTLADCRHPVSIITKSALIERDLDILAGMAKQQLAEVSVSITSLDNDLTRRLEPRAASPARRLKTIAALAAAGVPCGVMMAPIIPAVTDSEIETLLAAAAQAGAVGAGYVLLRLPHELKTIFADWLQTHLPLRANKVLAQLTQAHGGQVYNPKFFARHRGEGPLARLVARRFELAKNKHGLGKPRRPLRTDLFCPPAAARRLL